MNSLGRIYLDPGDSHENGSEIYGYGDNARARSDSNGKPANSFQAEDELTVGKGCNYATLDMKLSNLSDKRFGTAIFDPPEAEDSDDDMEVSVSNIDEDEDETVWGEPSSLSTFSREGSGTFKFKEEKQRAMEEVVNGKFKTIVYELLKTHGFSSSGEESEIWTEIITSLSWEAACFVKVDPADSKAMDPDGYVKVKCVATGSPSQSQFIRGLVFKKNACHKHMPTKHSNPRLLLIHGALDQSLTILSSFDSVKQEESHIESVIEKLAAYRPSVILVEKSAARFVQEFFLAKGMTLVSDMKLHRLQRIARCTGSPIISPDDVQNQTLKHCESFHLEKFVEEHAVVGEGGKKPSKTLMFLEGLATRFGCTILLKGASNDELKRLKSVVKYSVVMAYHLILETSFLVDQRVMFSSISFLEDSLERNSSVTVKDIPISPGFDKEQPHNFNLGFKTETTFSFEPYNPAILTGLSSISASVSKVVDDRFPLTPNSGTAKSKVDSHISVADSGISSQNALEKSNVGEVPGGISADFEVSLETNVNDIKDTDAQSECHSSSLLDTEGILVMVSVRNAAKGTICEQIHYTRIRFYKDMDVPLGKFFQERLFNQSGTCSTCSELPRAHFHYYAYHNKQLTVRVQRIADAKCLPGEREGILWMWSRCGKCYVIDGISKATYRVPVSAAARDLSFGKFLELSFSQYLTSSASGRCGHFLHRDFIHFFGIGKMVAMFSFSEVSTYTVVRPPKMLVFRKSIKREKLIDETEKVHAKGMLLFREIENNLQKIAPALHGLCLNIRDSVKEFADVEMLLSREKTEFEENIQDLYDDSPYQSVQKFLKLNLLLWELLVESCIWEKRLHDLLSIDPATIGTKIIKQTLQSELEDCKNKQLDESFSMKVSSPDDALLVTEIPIEANGSADGGLAQLCNEQLDDNLTEEPAHDTEKLDKLSSEVLLGDVALSDTESTCHVHSFSENMVKGKSLSCDDLSVDRDILISPENVANSSKSSPTCKSHDAMDSKQWIWTPFSDLRQEFVNDLQAGHLPIFEPSFSSTPELLPTVSQLISEEGQKLHIPLDKDIMLTYHEGELSSIIACALALLKDNRIPVDHVDEDNMKQKLPTNDSFQNLGHMGSFTSSSWSSTSSLHSDGSHSTSFSLDESRLSSFSGLDLLDSLLSLEAQHPEIPLGATKFGGKNKYSVVCLYAGRFRDLRNRCIPSELDYISSLSRCSNWNAKGGKSKAVFSKTLDDRFIVKEINRPEFDSFIKFAPEYFKYMTETFELRNPTCLAKIFGIYQVIIKQGKGGKEVKHDLLVMENLTFGRNISKQYDLKGALHDRFNSAADNSGEVFLDQNFVNDMRSSPLYVTRTEKHRLERALWNDTVFLTSIQVMDYSLLVGVDAEKKELVCGIIDYLRQYTWDKQLETWVKTSLVVPRNVMPTIISPVDYKKRFRKFMSTYFLWIPDEWCSQEDSKPAGSGAIASKVKPESQVKGENLSG